MADESGRVIKVVCPCCRATLSVDGAAGRVTEWAEAKDQRATADLAEARKILEEEKARLEAKYQEIVKADREKSAAMERKFKEFLERKEGVQGPPPLRDVDLD